MITSNLRMVKTHWTKLSHSVDTASREARDIMMLALTQLAKEEIKGQRGSGIENSGAGRDVSSGRFTSGTKTYGKATAGQPPMNRTGNLRRSIKFERFRTGFASYSALVGPTVIYGRSVEVGGRYAPSSWQGTTAMKGFPYMEPAYQKFVGRVYPQVQAEYIAKVMKS